MSTVETERQLPAPAVSTALAPLAWQQLALIAGAAAAILLLTLGGYGYDGDEVYFIAAGRHPDWGYADQPPLIPLIAALMDGLFPGSPFALRLPSALVIVGGVFLAGQLAREMGGERRAQLMSAAAYAIAFTSFGSLLLTASFNAVLWLGITVLVVRWVRLRREGATGRAADMPLLWAGVLTAVALQVKFLIPAFWVALVIGVLMSGPRDMLRRPLLWVGAAISVVTSVPGLIWQAANDWPQVKTSAVVRELAEETLGGRAMFLPNVLLTTGIVVGLVLFVYGLWKLFRSPDLREYRFLGWTALGVIAIFMIAGGRFTYASGIFPLLFAAAAVQMQVGRPSKWWRWSVSRPMFVFSALLILPTFPLLPHDSVEQVGAKISAGEKLSEDDVAADLATSWVNWPQQLTWPVLADAVAEAYKELPPDTVVVTLEYQTAGALEVLGPERGLPEHIYSYGLGFGYLHTPPAEATNFLFVGWIDDLEEIFTEVEQVGTVDGNAGELTGTKLMLATDPPKSLAELWPELQYP